MSQEPTLQDLLQAVQAVDTKVDRVEIKLSTVDQRFDTVDNKLGTVDQRFDAVDQKLTVVDQRFDMIDYKLSTADQRFDAVEQKLVVLDQRFDMVDGVLKKHQKESEQAHDEILSAINDFSTVVDKRFANIEDDIKSLQCVTKSLQKDNIHFKNVMVTKEYLDDKLFDRRGDLVTMIRKEDTKVTKLVSILSDHNVINAEEAQQVMLVTN